MLSTQLGTPHCVCVCCVRVGGGVKIQGIVREVRHAESTVKIIQRSKTVQLL